VKINRIYTNKDEVFRPIKFNPGFNVVFAQVKNPLSRTASSHNLGKTFLISVIDYALLATPKGKNPLRARPDVFNGFIFFIEVETNDGKYLTVRRPYGSKKNNVSIMVSDKTCEDLSDLDNGQWTYASLSLAKAKQIVDGAVGIDVLKVKGIGYRKLLTYFLRRQKDYIDVFRTSNFQRSRDAEWRPYVAHILGFDYELLAKKYKAKEDVEQLESRIKDEETDGRSSAQYGKVLSTLQNEETEVAELEGELDKFSFSGIESDISQQLVHGIERKISTLNTRRYKTELEIDQIDLATDTRFELSLESVVSIYAEIKLELPELLVRSYEELAEFQRQLTEGRHGRLVEARKKLRKDIATIEEELDELDARRQSAIDSLREKETFVKFVKSQRRVAERKERILDLKQELISLDAIEGLRLNLARKRSEAEALDSEVRKMTYEEPERFLQAKRLFSRHFRAIMASRAILYASINQSGNLMLDVRTIDSRDSGLDTSESEGTSFMKMLCVCYDLAILESYAEESFYRFVYHDGVFEGLDNRKKVSLLAMARELAGKGLQYILTVIDADLPRNTDDNKLFFSEDDIVLALDDSGDSGRLFQMPVF